MWFNEPGRRWMGQPPPQLRRRCRQSGTRTHLILEALEDRTLLSAPVSTTDGLVAAIITANSSGAATTITLAPGTEFDFTQADNFANGANALPVIIGNVTIAGNGAVLKGGSRTFTAFRAFDVGERGSLTVQNLTLEDFLEGDPVAAEGGAVYSSGTLNLTNVAVSGAEAKGNNGAMADQTTETRDGAFRGHGGSGGNAGSAFGGGLYVAGGSVTLKNDSITAVATAGAGGRGSIGSLSGPGGFGGNGGSASGGGLYVAGGSVSLTNDTFSGCRAFGGSGGDGFYGGGAISSNPGTGRHGGNGGSGGDAGSASGGGLYVAGGSVTLNNVTGYQCWAIGGHGGNGGNRGAGGDGGNGGDGGDSGSGTGGGLDVAGGSVTLNNDTWDLSIAVGNAPGQGGNGSSAPGKPGDGGQGGNGLGGGIAAAGGNVSLINNTVAQCLAGASPAASDLGSVQAGTSGNAYGGGLYAGGGSLTLANTLIATNGLGDNTASGSGPDVSGSVTSSDHDLIGNTSGSSGFSTSNGDILDIANSKSDVLNPSSIGLGSLGNNGGPTQTMALLPGSPAIDAGDSSAAALPATDQRGYARIVGNAVDIGAYEFGAMPASTDLSISGNALSSAVPGGQLAYTLTVTNNTSTAQSNVTLTDVLPTNTTLVSWTVPSGWSSIAPPVGSSKGNVSAWNGSLNANSSAVFTLVVQVKSSTPAGTVLTNIPMVGPITGDPNPANNSITLQTTVVQSGPTNQAPAITSSNSATFAAGQSASFTVTATGFPAPSLTESGSLPSGVSFTYHGNGTATLGGIPAAGIQGTYRFSISAHNGVGSDFTQIFTLTVNPAPVHLSPPPPLPPPLILPPLLALFDTLLGGVETIDANDTETIVDSFVGFPLLVSTFDHSGNLVSVDLFGVIDVTFLFG